MHRLKEQMETMIEKGCATAGYSPGGAGNGRYLFGHAQMIVSNKQIFENPSTYSSLIIPVAVWNVRRMAR